MLKRGGVRAVEDLDGDFGGVLGVDCLGAVGNFPQPRAESANKLLLGGLVKQQVSDIWHSLKSCIIPSRAVGCKPDFCIVMVRPVIPPSKVNVGDPTVLKPTEESGGKPSKKSASAKEKGHAPRSALVMKKKASKKPKESVVLSDPEAVKKIRKKKRKDGPSRSKQKKLARKMLALQRSTDPLLTKTVIKELAHDAAPELRFTKSAREALRCAVEAYAQGEFTGHLFFWLTALF